MKRLREALVRQAEIARVFRLEDMGRNLENLLRNGLVRVMICPLEPTECLVYLDHYESS